MLPWVFCWRDPGGGGGVVHGHQRAAAPIRVFPISVAGRPFWALVGLSGIFSGSCGVLLPPAACVAAACVAAACVAAACVAATYAPTCAPKAAFLFLLEGGSLNCGNYNLSSEPLNWPLKIPWNNALCVWVKLHTGPLLTNWVSWGMFGGLKAAAEAERRGKKREKSWVTSGIRGRARRAGREVAGPRGRWHSIVWGMERYEVLEHRQD